MFKTFQTLYEFKTTILKSKFYCFGFKVANETEAKQKVKEYKTKYKDATHLCYAYILGNNQETYYYSDGGEPNKTAGLPIYLAMRANKLSCSLIIIVRYFGGIKFGTKNLKDCFSNLANQTIKRAKLVNGCLVNLYKVIVSLNELKNLQHGFNKSIVKKIFHSSKVEVHLGLLPQQEKRFAMYLFTKLQDNYLLLG